MWPLRGQNDLKNYAALGVSPAGLNNTQSFASIYAISATILKALWLLAAWEISGSRRGRQARTPALPVRSIPRLAGATRVSRKEHILLDIAKPNSVVCGLVRIG